MWSHKEKALVHIYKNAAAIPDDEYRQILDDSTGHRSAANKNLGQGDFEVAMAAMEARLEYAINQGIVEAPTSGRIRDLDYWRNRIPQETGRVTDRQLRMIDTLLAKLKPTFAVQNIDVYLAGMVRKATGRFANIAELRVQEASALIDALKDRLAYARRGQ